MSESRLNVMDAGTIDKLLSAYHIDQGTPGEKQYLRSELVREAACSAGCSNTDIYWRIDVPDCWGYSKYLDGYQQLMSLQ